MVIRDVIYELWFFLSWPPKFHLGHLLDSSICLPLARMGHQLSNLIDTASKPVWTFKHASLKGYVVASLSNQKS